MEQYISGEEYNRLKDSSQLPKNRRTVNLPIIGIVIVVIIAALSFYAGVSYQKAHQTSPSTNTLSQGSGFGGPIGQRGLRVIGTVSSISSTSITVESRFGNSSNQTLSITSSTKITDNGQTVTVSDIQTGDTVLITKTSNSSTAASAIEVNPSFGGFGGNPGDSSSNGSATNGTGSSTNGSATVQ